MKRTPAFQERLDMRAQATLSPCEDRVLQFLSEGMTPKEISYELTLSQKTVYAHCKSIMQRLGLHDLHALILFAAGNGKQNGNNRQHAIKKQ